MTDHLKSLNSNTGKFKVMTRECDPPDPKSSTKQAEEVQALRSGGEGE